MRPALSQPVMRSRDAAPAATLPSLALGLCVTLAGFESALAAMRAPRWSATFEPAPAQHRRVERIERLVLAPPLAGPRLRPPRALALPPRAVASPSNRARAARPVLPPADAPPDSASRAAPIPRDDAAIATTASPAAPLVAPSIAPLLAGPRAAVAAVAVRFLGLATLDSAARDSMLQAVERGKASAARERARDIMAPVVAEEWRRWAAVRASSDRLRPTPAAGQVWDRAGSSFGATGPISAPLFASGPSRARRQRDSSVHADNLARLARIEARIRARRDSLAVARP